jgi:flagellar hook protein FlgE
MATWDESYGSGGGFRPVTGTVPIYSVTFDAGLPAPGATINLNELNDRFAMEAFESSTNIYAAALVDGTVEILDSYTVTGTVSMQGRLTYADVPVVITNTETPPWGPYEVISFDEPLDNLIFTEVAGGIYRVTTDQPRYLNVTADLNKTFTTTGDRSISALALRGGNAQWSDNIINVSDAGVIGAAYGTGDITSNGDVNFDGYVNISDLAIVGGNFYLTSSGAYSAWIP